ncbi:A24 family peptidase [Curvivirga sp.]|uniref:A24 family peptidase n=1 Tax=Curvivirga sp. TaxID=2856848 RepID=UPI003B5AA7D4
MTFPSLFFYLCIAQFVGLCLFAAANDARFFKLPNKIIALIFALFVPMALVCLSWDQAMYHIVASVAVLVVGFILFAFNIFGAGDAKFLAGVSLWAGIEMLPVLLLTMGMVGGFMGLIQMMRRRYDVSFVLGYLHLKKIEEVTLNVKVPYGVAISAGALVVSIIQIVNVAQKPLSGIGG